jgi:hypothetical protein
VGWHENAVVILFTMRQISTGIYNGRAIVILFMMSLLGTLQMIQDTNWNKMLYERRNL